ncbi:MAG: AMP-binding protein [Lautropia sp.]
MLRTGHVDHFARDHLPSRELQPEFLWNRPELQYPERLNATSELLDATIAAGHGDRIALRTDESACTYRQLQAQVNRIAHVLRNDMGLVPGNRVLLRGANNPMMAACVLAVWKAGLVAVPTMPLLRARELRPLLEKAQIGAALCDIRLKDELVAAQPHSPLVQVLYFNDGDGTTPAGGSLEAICAQRPAEFPACDTARDDIALIAFTSGTTGQPKGTMHMHHDIVAMCDLFPRSVLKPTADDIFSGTPPLAFTFGLGGMLCFPLRFGASTLLLERCTPESLLAAVARHRVSVLFTAPTFYRQMAPFAASHDIRSLQKTVSAGEALPDATRTLWRNATGLEMIDGIGATEMIHIFVAAAGRDVRPGAIGKVVPGYQARIVDDQMRTLPPGTIGRLAVRGPTGCRYLADERQRDYVKQGWNLTGDTFLMDPDGYLYYQARSDDMIISAGYNIAGPEVEDALLAHPAVAECGVVAVPDPERGQAVKAFIVLRPGAQGGPELARTLQDHVKQTIAPYKYPRVIEFVESLPRTETGKLQRFKLRAP